MSLLLTSVFGMEMQSINLLKVMAEQRTKLKDILSVKDIFCNANEGSWEFTRTPWVCGNRSFIHMERIIRKKFDSKFIW